LGCHGGYHEGCGFHTLREGDTPRLEAKERYTFIFDLQLTILVLYSHKDQAWKIADFGLTQEGTSKKALTTRYSRGTSSYRAPELLLDERYTNKIDIWAIGCILYELVFKGKAFATDISVVQYTHDTSSGKSLPLPFEPDTLPDESRKAFVSKIIAEMLNVNASDRPAADQLYRRFIGWGAESFVSKTAGALPAAVGSSEREASAVPHIDQKGVPDPIDQRGSKNPENSIGMKVDQDSRSDSIVDPEIVSKQRPQNDLVDSGGTIYPSIWAHTNV